MPEAERYFESFQPYDFSYNTRAELYLGRIAQALGRPQIAAAHYARFLRWWEPADAEYRGPWREARAALDTLASSAK